MHPALSSSQAALRITVVACLILVSSGGGLASDELTVHLRYDPATVTVALRDGLADVRMPGSELLPRVGAPALPMLSEQVVLPDGMAARNVRVSSIATTRIPCGKVHPFQPPAILGLAGAVVDPPEGVDPDPAIYGASALYPQELARFCGNGRLGDINLAACEIHPVQYDPVAQELIVYTEMVLTLELAQAERDQRPAAASPEMDRIVRRMARSGMHGTLETSTVWDDGHGVRLDPGDYQYVIITENAQLSAYEEYAAWKTAKGVPATTVTVEWIDATYQGRDLAEKMRNFIIEAVSEWGTAYVLLGGDSHLVPSRIAWAFDCEAGFHSDENDLYADLYFSDLDGTWDANGNSIFGEVDDEVDLYPDIMVGRAPTDDLAQAQAVVDKFLAYEKTPAPGRAMEAFFFAEILWSDPYTDSGIGKDMIAEQHFSAAYDPIERQYESLGNESPSSVLNYLNWGPHLANHSGHANYQVMGCGDGYIDRGDVADLTNAPYFFVLYSIGCWAGAFDYGCIGEHFIVNGDGGAVAFVGNSRYGWGSPGNPGWGYSETFDADFYGAILSEDLAQFGPAVAWPKVLRVPYSQDENVYRWHEYQVNLLGDPEMTCHTAEITALLLDAPMALPTGATQFTATVSDAGGAVSGARLCLAGPDVYQVGFSDAAGQVTFAVDIAAAQELTLTATAPNHPHSEQQIVVAGNDPFLTVSGTDIDDDAVMPSAGNDDGDIGPGEVIELFVTVHNYGGSDCSGVTGTLAVDAGDVTVLTAEADYGTVAAGTAATNQTPFVFQVSHGFPAAETIPFTIALEDDASNVWQSELPLLVVAPGPRVAYTTVDDSWGGDGDGVVEPGETVDVTVFVTNEGSGNLGPVEGTLTTTDPDLLVVEGAASTDVTLDPGQTAALSPAYRVQVESSSPETTYGDLDILFTHDEGSYDDAFLLQIGEPGFADDMESGEGDWTHSGSNDMWHLTDYRQHSGTHSWYCGNASHQYANNTDASLVSPYFVVPEDGRFSFWCYYDVTIYGVDGLNVDVWQDGDWHTLGYHGSGGALDSTLFVCDWAEYSYDLEGLTPGEWTQVRFRFESDGSDTDEGFYIDDVTISGPATSGAPLPLEPSAFRLAPAQPNPSSQGVAWRLSLPSPARVSGKIYGPSGRLITTLMRRPFDTGRHLIQWNGLTREGSPAPAGVYFLHLDAGSRRVVDKFVRVRR
ncbi:MAG: hypothetical protein GF355_16210 [Candidatus Eisenbacteria bacterium]|nr:hypothetical protein [Candidatus Eisenbacteria bacterium]